MNPTTAAGQAHPASAIPKRQAATTTGVIRNEPLDWLRGLLALSIMFYHLRTWEFFFIRAPFQHRAQPVLLLVCAAAFLLYPVAGDAIHLVTGAARIVFCLASVGLVYAAYRMDIALPSWLARPLVQLGLATYGVYLLHPVIWQAVRLLLGRLQWDLHGWPVLVGVSIATVLIAVALFHTMESYFIRLGKRLTSKSDSSTATAAA